MYLHFDKYHGTGNDFVIVNNLRGDVQLTTEQVAFICDRRFGVGADGLMLLNSHSTFDFEMVYYNADGKPSTMCGNGGRCLAHFAFRNGIQKEVLVFDAVDGLHTAIMLPNNWVKLQMTDVLTVQQHTENSFELDTGSPHYVQYVPQLYNLPVVDQGRAIRNSPTYAAQGINVNFVENIDQFLHVRTYERGVEDETFSCGTGVTAAAITTATQQGKYQVAIKTKGGELSVNFTKNADQSFTDVWLSGPASFVFAGVIEL
ncbi:MAG: diaminopimelate epimerase [Bacteroidetes bacterium]|nr:MAG: diaminopimelate epimerase [Bacteroidota bacterium]TAF93651.1 MAG: diaminopimelate epimerase [Bacteroidota bacterium]